MPERDPTDFHHVRITLRALPRGVPAFIRFRSLLKSVLRRFGFHCETVEYLDAPQTAEKRT